MCLLIHFLLPLYCMSIDLRLLVTLWYVQPFLICTCSIVMLKHKFISKWSRIPTLVIIVEKSQHVQILRNYAYLRHRTLLNARRMPQLSLEQREQAIGRLNSAQRSQLVAQSLNCTVGTIQRLQER